MPDDPEQKQVRGKLLAAECQLALGAFLLLFPPVLLCDRSFGETGWIICLWFCVVGFLAFRMMPPFLIRRGLPLQDLARLQIGFMGVPFLAGLITQINRSTLKIDLPIANEIIIAAIVVSGSVGAALLVMSFLAMNKLRQNPVTATLPPGIFRS